MILFEMDNVKHYLLGKDNLGSWFIYYKSNYRTQVWVRSLELEKFKVL